LYNTPLFPSILSLKTLTELTLLDYNFDLRMDTLLDFLEESRSLESATLEISFPEQNTDWESTPTPIDLL